MILYTLAIMTQIKEPLKGQATNPKSRSKKETETKYNAFYDKDGYANICEDCSSKIMRKILSEHNISKLKLKNKTDFLELMAITYDFIDIVENAENQESD